MAFKEYAEQVKEYERSDATRRVDGAPHERMKLPGVFTIKSMRDRAAYFEAITNLQAKELHAFKQSMNVTLEYQNRLVRENVAARTLIDKLQTRHNTIIAGVLVTSVAIALWFIWKGF